MNKQDKVAELCLQKLRIVDLNPSQQLPLHLTSSFSFDDIETCTAVFAGAADGYVYSRYRNPTVDAVAKRIAELEGVGFAGATAAIMTSSGMAAIYVLLTSLLPSGGTIVTQSDLYGGTTELLFKVVKKTGINIVLKDFTDMEDVSKEIRGAKQPMVVYLETPTNPCLNCIDIAAVAAIAKSKDVPVIVDNTFATPYLQRPLTLGAQFVIHSTTKYLNGHGTGIAGVIVGSDMSVMQQTVWPVLKLTGAICNPFDAWLVGNGIRTLPLRMDRHCENALGLSKYLQNHPGVEKVYYPGLPDHPTHDVADRQMFGFGGMLSFVVPGGKEGAFKVMNKLRIASIAPTLGDVDTLILHPATSSHLNVQPEIRAQFGIVDGMIRVSVGIEPMTSILDDFAFALE